MVDGRVEGDGKLVAGLHGDGLGAIGYAAADVAAQVRGVEVRHWRVLQPGWVGVTPYIAPGWVLDPVRRQLLEDVVAARGCRESGEEEEQEGREETEGTPRNTVIYLHCGRQIRSQHWLH